MRKHVVPMQHAVVVNTLSAKRHLVEEKVKCVIGDGAIAEEKLVSSSFE